MQTWRNETPSKRTDRNFDELLGDLRVALPGVQVLFAFLLTIVGLTFLAIAMTGVVMLVTDFVFGTATTIVATAAIVVVFAVLWYVMPVRRRRGLEGE